MFYGQIMCTLRCLSTAEDASAEQQDEHGTHIEPNGDARIEENILKQFRWTMKEDNRT